MILAGDIGGTKTLLGLFEPDRGPREPIDLRSFATVADTPPAERVRSFLSGREVQTAVLGVAGAVIEGRARGSNLPWEVAASDLASAIEAPTRLINDLHAIARWVPELRPDERRTLQSGSPDPEGAIGVIAPGTGMGESMLFHWRGRHRPAPSEAGHVDFAPADELQVRWWRFLHERHGHVSLERACSGSSLPALVGFLAADRGIDVAPECAEALAEAQDPTPLLVEAGLDGRCRVCAEALLVFSDMLAAAAGNLALQIVATGGVYLGGGLPPRIRPLLETERWRDRFHDKGRFRSLMERIPIHVIDDDRAALLGAATVALDGDV